MMPKPLVFKKNFSKRMHITKITHLIIWKRNRFFIAPLQDLHQLSINRDQCDICTTKTANNSVERVCNSNWSTTFLSWLMCVPQIILQSPLSGLQLDILKSACLSWILLITLFIWVYVGNVQPLDEHCVQKWSWHIKRTIGQCTFIVTHRFLILMIYAPVTL